MSQRPRRRRWLAGSSPPAPAARAELCRAKPVRHGAAPAPLSFASRLQSSLDFRPRGLVGRSPAFLPFLRPRQGPLGARRHAACTGRARTISRASSARCLGSAPSVTAPFVTRRSGRRSRCRRAVTKCRGGGEGAIELVWGEENADTVFICDHDLRVLMFLISHFLRNARPTGCRAFAVVMSMISSRHLEKVQFSV